MSERYEYLLGRVKTMVRQVSLMACAVIGTGEMGNAVNTDALKGYISRSHQFV